MLCNFLYFLSSADFFQNQLFRKILLGTLSECQMVWTQIRNDVLSVLICVQTACKGYQQTAKVAASKERVKACPAEYFYELHSSPIFILLTCNMPVVRSEWKTVWILIRWLRQKPADLDLHCFKKKRTNPVQQCKV